MSGNLQQRYGQVSDLCGNIDELLAKTALGSNAPASAKTGSVKRMDELYVPLPEIVNLSKVLHSPGQSQTETISETKQVDKAIETVDAKLAERRSELGLQLEFLGFSNWRKDLEELQRRDKSKNVEDLISDVYKVWDLNSKKDILEIKGQKLGGALANLKNSLEEWNNLSWAGSAFSVFTGHRSTLKAQVETDKNLVRSRFKTIQEFSQELKAVRSELLEAKERDKERDVVVQKAQAAFSSGDVQQAQALSIKADSLIEVIKTRLLRADERLSHRHSVDYEKQMAELRKAQEKWTQVDKSYGTTINVMDSSSRAMMMCAAVGLGMVLVPVGLTALGAFAMTFAITTGVGALLATVRNGAQGLSSKYNGVDFSWSAAGQDILSTTKESALMGLGGGMMAGFKAALGIGAAATRIAAGTSWASRAWNFTRAAAGSGGTAVGTSLPSSIYHGYFEEYRTYKSQVHEMVYGDNKMSQEEYQWMNNKGMIPDAQEKGIIRRDPKTGEIILELSEQDKKDLYLTLTSQRRGDLVWIYGMDMGMNFICGFGGHYMSGARNFHLKGLTPSPAIVAGAPKVTPVVSGSALATKGALLPLNLSTHAMELVTSKFSADLNLAAREKYLHEEITEEVRIRTYSQAFTSQIVGNIQGDFQARQQRMAENFKADAEVNANNALASNVKKTGVKVDELETLHLVNKENGKVVGTHREIPIGTKWGDLRHAAEALSMWVADAASRACEKVTGKPREVTLKRANENLDAALNHLKNQGEQTDDFKTKFGTTSKARFEVEADRQARVTIDQGTSNKRTPKSEFDNLVQHLKSLLGEADYHSNRYLRGDGKDSNGPASKLADGWKSTVEKVKSNIYDAGKAVGDLFPPARWLADATSAFVGGGANLTKKIWSFASDSVVGDLIRVPIHYATNIVLVKPILNLLVNYSAFNSATLLHGPAGVAALWTVSLSVADHLGFTVGRKLGLNKSRPIDAADAICSKMALEQTLSRIKELSDAHPEFKLSKKLESHLVKTAKTLDTVFTECSQRNVLKIPLLHRVFGNIELSRYDLFYGMGLASLYGLGSIGSVSALSVVAPAAGIYAAYKVLGKVPTALGTLYIAGHTLPVVGGIAATCAIGGACAYYGLKAIAKVPKLNVAVADMFTTAGHWFSANTGTGRFIRGESVFHDVLSVASPALILGGASLGMGPWCLLPIALPFWRSVGVHASGFLTDSCLKIADSLTPSTYRISKKYNFTGEILADFQTAYRRGLTEAVGFNHMKLHKALEDQLVADLISSKTDVKKFAAHLETLFREVAKPIRDQILYRLSVVADVDPEIVNAARKAAEKALTRNKPKWDAMSEVDRIKAIADFEKGLHLAQIRAAKRVEEKREKKLAAMTPEKRAEAVAKYNQATTDRLNKLKEPFGPDAIAELYEGNRKTHTSPVEEVKQALLKKLIEDRDTKEKVTEHLTPHKDPKKPSPSETEVFVSRAKRDLSSEVYKAMGDGPVDIARVMTLLKARESYDSYDNIRRELMPETKKSGKGVIKTNEGLILKIVNKEIELQKEIKKVEADNSKSVVEKAEEVRALQQQADNLSLLARSLELYVLRRENAIKILMGQDTINSFNFKQTALDPTMDPRMKARLIRKLLSKRKGAVEVDEEGKREKVLVIDENMPRITREQQRNIIDTFTEELNRSGDKLKRGESELSLAEKQELISWAMKEINKGKKDIIDRKVRQELENPTSVAPRLSLAFWENAKRRNLVKLATQGLKPKETHVTRRTEALLKDPRTAIESAASAYETKLREAAERSSRLGIKTEADADKLIASLVIDPNQVNTAITNEMREFARTIADQNKSLKAKHKAEDSLRAQILADHDYIKSIFKKTASAYHSEAEARQRAEALIKDPKLQISPGAKRYELKLRAAAERSSKLGVKNVADIDRLITNLEANPNIRNKGINSKMRALAVEMADTSKSTTVRDNAKQKLRNALGTDLAYIEKIFKKSERGVEYADSPTSVDARTTALIKRSFSKIDGADLPDRFDFAHGVMELCKINPWPLVNCFSRTFTHYVTTTRARAAARRSAELGIQSAGDVNTLVTSLKKNPKLDNPGLTWKMRNLAGTMADMSQSAKIRLEAESNLRALLATDLNQVKGVFTKLEAKRKAAEDKIKKSHEQAFAIMSPMEANLARYAEIADLVRKNVTAKSIAWTTNNVGIFRRVLGLVVPVRLAPVQLTDSSVIARRPSLWDSKVDSHDYRGYSWEECLPTVMPSRYASLDMSLRAADPKAYGDSWWQQKVASWLTGPIDMRYSGLYGDSWLARAPGWNWMLRRLGHP